MISAVVVAALFVGLAGASPLPDTESFLDARRLLELGDYPGAEKVLEKVLASLPDDSRAERATRLAQLAEARVLQGLDRAASADIERALALDGSPPVRRSAVFIYLRCQKHREARPIVESLLETSPDDATLRFSHGIVLARMGELERAIVQLPAGLDLPGAGRDARFELALALSKLDRPAQALVRLREILEDDPYDAEACYQASRQLLRIRSPAATRVAATLVRYFEALREAEGESSRDQHLAHLGRPAEAALERAAKWERLGDFARVFAEVEKARSLGSSAAAGWLESFLRRQGFGPGVSTDELALAISSRGIAGSAARAQRAARILLARDARSVPALQELLDGAAEPSLVVPRLHYAKRLAEAEPENAARNAELVTLRASLEGASPPR